MDLLDICECVNKGKSFHFGFCYWCYHLGWGSSKQAKDYFLLTRRKSRAFGSEGSMKSSVWITSIKEGGNSGGRIGTSTDLGRTIQSHQRSDPRTYLMAEI